MAAEGQGANKIEPVLTYQMHGDTSAWDTTLNDVGRTNLRIQTSNGYSPHLYPEYITAMEYYYGAAPRPGFMGRFLVGESTVRAPYWSVSPNSFGGQIGASPNGDAPGDIYRLLGGVVLRRPGQDPLYAGYIASAFMLPKGTNNNRVVAPGSEDLNGPLGEKARFYLVGLRPGTAFPVGGHVPPRAADRSAAAGRDPLHAHVSRRPPEGGGRGGRPVRVVCRIDRMAARRGRGVPLSDRRVVERLHGAHAGPARKRRRVLRLFDRRSPPAPRACASTAPRSARSRPRRA